MAKILDPAWTTARSVAARGYWVTSDLPDMFERRFFSHVSPGGGDLADRARRSGFARRNCSWMVGEVLAWGVGSRSTAAGTVRAWMNSPSHRRILISGRYGQIGIGLQAGTPYDAYPVGLTAAAVLGRRHC